MLRRFTTLSLAALAACSSGDPATPPVPAGLAVVTQPATVAQSGVLLSRQPVVELRDASGNPVASKGVLITASVTGGGTLTGQVDVRTDVSGRAAYSDLAINGAVGARTLRFVSGSLTSTLSDAVQLGPGAPATAAPSAGNNQTGAAGTDLAVAPAVLISDGSGNPVPGVAVTFAVVSGGGSLQGAAATTGGDGVAKVGKWTLGTAIGPNSLKATAGALEVTFVATATVGPAARLTIISKNNQTAVAGAPVDSAPAVKVFDAFDNPVPGVAVTFAVASGGGTLTTPNPVSDAAGIARVGSWSLGYVGGSNTVTASRAGAPSVTFTATGTDFKAVALEAGDFHTCAVKAGGAGYCWGFDGNGENGDGDAVDDSLPVPVSGGLTFTTIATGQVFSCGIVTGGAVYCWGDNSVGQLGDGTNNSSAVPVKVSGSTTFTAIDAGQAHACALATNGTILCWGSNSNGRLGDNTTVSHSVPTPVSGGDIFTSVSVGTGHSCALRSDGAVLCWGTGANGRIGDGATLDRRVPTLVAGGLTFTAVAAGGFHSCALTAAGAAYCWGQGTFGAIGTGTNASVNVPTAVSGGLVFTTIVAGASHGCGLVAPGDAYCWGQNNFGELGDGTITTRFAPVKALGQGLTFTAVTAGGQHTCFLATTAGAFCLGRNDVGMLGTGNFISTRKLAAVHP